MEVFSLSGPSGTGKSTIALSFAHENKIPAIIDDGLLILNGHKIAGKSAKFEKNSLTAVRRAAFFDEDHAREVRLALSHYYIDRILIIGTSDKMVQLIAANLGLGKIDHYFYVEDLRSSSEIKIAQYIRKTEGKHVIPIPYKQVEQNFFKKLIQRGVEIFSTKKERIGETTIVHPDFHRGNIKIYKHAFKDIIEITCFKYPDIKECKNISIDLQGPPSVQIALELSYPLSSNLTKTVKSVQKDIHDQFMRQLDIEFFSIDLTIMML